VRVDGQCRTADPHILAVGDVAEAIHPHPTLAETLGAAAEVHFGTATELYRPKRDGHQ